MACVPRLAFAPAPKGNCRLKERHAALYALRLRANSGKGLQMTVWIRNLFADSLKQQSSVTMMEICYQIRAHVHTGMQA